MLYKILYKGILLSWEILSQVYKHKKIHRFRKVIVAIESRVIYIKSQYLNWLQTWFQYYLEIFP
jgi:hypothetical protein